MLDVLQRIAEVSEIATFVYTTSPIVLGTVSAARERLFELLPELSARQKAIVLQSGNAQVIAVLTINEDLLKDLTDRISEEMERERRAIQSGNKREVDAASDRAEREICTYLRRIRDRNEDTMPEGDWIRWWKSYKCVA